MRFQNSIVMERLPCYHEEVNNMEELHVLVIEVVSNLNIEFDHRFNTELWMSFESLKPPNISFLDAEQLRPMLNLIQTIPVVSWKVEDLSFDQLKSECNVFRSMLKEFSDEQDRLAEIESQKKVESPENVQIVKGQTSQRKKVK